MQAGFMTFANSRSFSFSRSSAQLKLATAHTMGQGASASDGYQSDDGPSYGATPPQRTSTSRRAQVLSASGLTPLVGRPFPPTSPHGQSPTPQAPSISTFPLTQRKRGPLQALQKSTDQATAIRGSSSAFSSLQGKPRPGKAPTAGGKKRSKNKSKKKALGCLAPAPFATPSPVLQDPRVRARPHPRSNKENNPTAALPQNLSSAPSPHASTKVLATPALLGRVTSTGPESPAPMTSTCPVRLVDGVKCYMVDEATECFVFDLLDAEECDELVARAERHVASASGGDGWRKLYTYTKVRS